MKTNRLLPCEVAVKKMHRGRLRTPAQIKKLEQLRREALAEYEAYLKARKAARRGRR